MQLKQRQTYLDTRVERNGLYHLPAEGQKVQSWDVVFWTGAAVVQTSKSTWYQFPLHSYGSETAKEHRLQLLDNFCRTHSLPCVMCDLFSHCAVM